MSEYMHHSAVKEYCPQAKKDIVIASVIAPKHKNTSNWTDCPWCIERIELTGSECTCCEKELVE